MAVAVIACIAAAVTGRGRPVWRAWPTPSPTFPSVACRLTAASLLSTARARPARRRGASWPSPGLSGFCWLSCGAQPVMVTISKVAGDPPVGPGEALGVDLRRARQHRAGQRPPRPVDQHVGLAHGPQVPEQLQRMGVAHLDPVDVGHRQGEAGALQQAGGVHHVGEGRDPRPRAAERPRPRPAAAPGAARSGSRRPGSRRGTGRRASARGGSGPGRRAGRWSSAGPGSRPPGRGSRRERQPLLVGDQPRAGPARQHGLRQVGLDQQAHPLARRAFLQRRRNAPSRAPRSTATGKLRMMASSRSTASAPRAPSGSRRPRSRARRGPGGGGAGRGRTGGAGQSMALQDGRSSACLETATLASALRAAWPTWSCRRAAWTARPWCRRPACRPRPGAESASSTTRSATAAARPSSTTRPTRAAPPAWPSRAPSPAPAPPASTTRPRAT